MGFILLPWEHQRTQPWVWGYRDSEERSQALPGIGVLLGGAGLLWLVAGQEWEELGTLVRGVFEPRG